MADGTYYACDALRVTGEYCKFSGFTCPGGPVATERMIKAGANVLRNYNPALDDLDTYVKLVYNAMRESHDVLAPRP